MENNRYVYNDSNQLAEATLCSGRTTRKVCYTYDADGNLLKEYSPTDNGQTSYQYTVENRLEAVYTGNTYNKTRQMAAAYDGDGNRVCQVNYNPEKDEDFSCYYRTYNSCDYNGTGIQLKACGEVSPTEEDLISLIAPASKYELIEYVNDVNREYVEVLVEQNINGRTDTTYTYGVDRISKELFNQTNRTSYYLYDPRGSVAGLADAKGHLTKTYQYSPTGELTHGAAAHENEYTYNGESYNPNIQSQYLRARYYSVVTANFLTEDSYLGSINEPLTLNRYNYCISSYPNYMDPGGNLPWRDILQQGTKMGPILPAGGAKLEDTYQAGLDIWNGAKSVARTVKSFGMGVRDSLLKAFIDKPFVSMLPWAALTEKAYSVLHRQDYPNPLLGESLPLYSEWRPTEWLKGQIAANETRIQALTGEIEDRNAYYLGRCGGDVLTGLIGFAESFLGSSMVAFGASTLAAEAASGAGLVLAPGSLAMVAGGVLVAVDGATETAYAVQMLGEDIGRYRGSRAEKAGSESGIPQKAKDALDKIDKDAKSYLEDHYGGVEYKNRPNTKIGETKIPNKNITTYIEYDINPYKYGKSRGTERIVIGLDGSAWYTPDHYKTWYQIR